MEQITRLLFLKMDAGREDLPGEASAIPPPWRWRQLANQNVFAGKLVPQEPAAELLAPIRASRAAQPQNTRRSSA